MGDNLGINLEELRKNIKNESNSLILNQLEDLYTADIVSVIDEIEAKEGVFVLRCLEKSVASEILTQLESSSRKPIIKNMSSPELAEYINILDSDDAVDILSEQSIKIREEVIALLADREQARFIIDLMIYPEDVAGGIMQKELIKVNVNERVNECIEEIRRQAQDNEKLYNVYVVDDKGILLGTLSLKKIILAKKNTIIQEIYDEDVISVETYLDVVEVAELIQRHDLESIAVVNIQGRLLGQIMVDDILDIITDQAQEDIQAITGLTDEVEEGDSVWSITKARLPWLGIGMMGSLLAAKFLGLFEADLLHKVPTLALFIPIVGSTGGNVGIQTSSFMVQLLSEKVSFDNSHSKRLLKISMVSLLQSLIISGFVFLVTAFILGHSIHLASVVGLSLLGVVLLASFMGTVTPLILNRFGYNPAVASGPLITTANDLLGYGVYFWIAYNLF